MRIAIEINTGKLRFEPVVGRRTSYCSFTFFRWTLWFQWWDTERAWHGKPGRACVLKSRDGLMCATAGLRKCSPRLRHPLLCPWIARAGRWFP